jgi:hypothetical protein
MTEYCCGTLLEMLCDVAEMAMMLVLISTVLVLGVYSSAVYYLCVNLNRQCLEK